MIFSWDMSLFFYLFGGLCLLGCLGVSLLRNPIYAVLSLIFAFLSGAGVLILLKNEFLSMLLIIVYVGAVATLFLFIVMMLKPVKLDKHSWRYYLIAGVISAMLLTSLIYAYYLSSSNVGDSINVALATTTTEAGAVAGGAPIRSLGQVLYTKYAYYIEIIAMILLLAMVGCILLSKRTKGDPPPQPRPRLRKDRIESIMVIKKKDV